MTRTAVPQGKSQGVTSNFIFGTELPFDLLLKTKQTQLYLAIGIMTWVPVEWAGPTTFAIPCHSKKAARRTFLIGKTMKILIFLFMFFDILLISSIIVLQCQLLGSLSPSFVNCECLFSFLFYFINVTSVASLSFLFLGLMDFLFFNGMARNLDNETTWKFLILHDQLNFFFCRRRWDFCVYFT